MNDVIVIAEAGVNHNGDKNIAKRLIEVAATAGCDYVKFQTFKADRLVSRSALKAEYQTRNIEGKAQTQYEMLKQLEMPDEWHEELRNYSIELGIKFLSTGFDEESITLLNNLGMDLFKVPSGEITNLPYLEHIAHFGKPVVLSTGMASIDEIEGAITAMEAVGLTRDKMTVLHCNTEYPTPMKDVNLRAMNHIREVFGVEVGYSDHTLGIEVSVAAVALGATIIEKHYTLDRKMSGPDHRASLEPEELIEMVRSIRNVKLAIGGTGLKVPSESELKNKVVARKSIHLRCDISEGTVISREHLIMKRPGDGISPMQIDQVVGLHAQSALTASTKLTWELLK
jgi:N,N'-diacetyllegionaminate synthase